MFPTRRPYVKPVRPQAPGVAADSAMAVTIKNYKEKSWDDKAAYLAACELYKLIPSIGHKKAMEEAKAKFETWCTMLGKEIL